MSPNEINFIKHLVDIIEAKNEKIIELSIVESQNKIEEVKKQWNILLEKEETSHAKTKKELSELVMTLQDNGFIPDEVRKNYNIVK